MRDDSNGEIHFFIRDLENYLRIFNRNYRFVIKITILLFFQKLEFLGSYSLRTKCNKRRIKCQNGVRPNWSLIFGELIRVEVEREGEEEKEEEEEEEGEEGEESQRNVWNLLSFVWNLFGNYDFGMDYWTFGLLYGIVC